MKGNTNWTVQIFGKCINTNNIKWRCEEENKVRIVTHKETMNKRRDDSAAI